ncbi:hypothetical protein [Pseudomonas fluorescens]|uniref:hypothetical protein n=1 Tax=Pseudomonas fluorescens TaxID=294 RepID=UPI001241CA1D|nr:hypothetical protein [Pseudomonas fluorescens]
MPDAVQPNVRVECGTQLEGSRQRGAPLQGLFGSLRLLIIIGLVTKNAILIRELATSLQAESESLVRAAKFFRPIVIASLVFIIGAKPYA